MLHSLAWFFWDRHPPCSYVSTTWRFVSCSRKHYLVQVFFKLFNKRDETKSKPVAEKNRRTPLCEVGCSAVRLLHQAHWPKIVNVSITEAQSAFLYKPGKELGSFWLKLVLFERTNAVLQTKIGGLIAYTPSLGVLTRGLHLAARISLMIARYHEWSLLRVCIQQT